MAPERDLFGNFERMRRDIDELFGDVFERAGFAPRRAFSPNIDVYYCGRPPRAIVKVDLAGVDVDDVGIEIRGRQIVISGERKSQEGEGRLYQQLEIPHGPFRRVVELGADVVADDAKASYDDGVLRLEVPLANADEQIREIPIRSRKEGT
ncbi:MAG: Hsp20/alpha crystallin family protein [Thermoleophilaceae bacterium]|jgi:HSP20 family protein